MYNPVLKISREDISRMDSRKMFSEYYKALDKNYRQMAAEYFRAFRDAFYNVKDGIELCEKKGLENKVRVNGKKVRAYAYLDYITKDELDYLTEAVKVLPNFISDEKSEIYGVAYIKAQIKEYGIERRRDFEYDHNFVPPENIEICEKSSRTIQRCYAKMIKKNTTFTSQQKENINEFKIDEQREKESKGNTQYRVKKFTQTTLDSQGMEL